LISTGAGLSARSVVVGLVLGGALVLAGCSSPKQSATTTTAPTTSNTSSATTTVPATTTTTVPGCTGANYTVKVLGTEGAAGTNEVTFGLRNTSSATCTLFGYPGIQLLGPGDAAMATDEVEGGGQSFTDFARANVSVGPGATAYFTIGYSDVTTGTESTCPRTAAVQVIPPNTTTPLIVSGQYTVCGAGTVNVSPVFGAGSPETETTAPPGP
jgi:hypothetical protein